MARNRERTDVMDAALDAARMVREVGGACILVRAADGPAPGTAGLPWTADPVCRPIYAARPAADVWDGDDPEGWSVLWTIVEGLPPDPRLEA